MKPNGRDYTIDPVLKRLAHSDHATLTLARRLKARSPHTAGFQIIDMHDDDEDDGSDHGHISDVSASQAEPGDLAPPPTEEQQGSTAPPLTEGNVENVVLVKSLSQETAEVAETTPTQGEQHEGVTEKAPEKAEDAEDTVEDTRAAIEKSLGATLSKPKKDDDDADFPPEQKFKCTVPGCNRTFTEHHELKCTSSFLGTR